MSFWKKLMGRRDEAAIAELKRSLAAEL